MLLLHAVFYENAFAILEFPRSSIIVHQPMFQAHRRNSSGYRSSRSVIRPDGNVGTSKLSRTKIMLIAIGVFALSMTTIIPMFLLETTTSSNGFASSSLHNVLSKSEEELRNLIEKQRNNEKIPIAKKDTTKKVIPEEAEKSLLQQERKKHSVLARGVSGLPMSQTPALDGAEWGHIGCDTYVDDMAYWNDPQGTRDQNFVSPFSVQNSDEQQRHKKFPKYLTFEPDPGGWNNIRMSMEIIFVIAASTGRTLVLPPKAPFYLLGMGEEHARSFGSFYDMSKSGFKNEFEVISMEEFFEREVFSKQNNDEQKQSLNFLTDEEVQQFKETKIHEMCLYRTGANNHCENLFKHLRKAGYQPPLESSVNCFIFDQDVYNGQAITHDLKEHASRFCGKERTPIYYNQTMHQPQLIHWDGSQVDARTGGHRLLNHFYSFLFFTDPVVDNHYKRFVRDFLHYKESLYCAAGKIVHALNNKGPWSSLHVRRGDLQYKEVKIPAHEWYENLKDIWDEGETLFIATDERNKTFFDPIREHHNVRFLDDYWDVGNLDDLDPYYLGMVDTIIASHGRTFAGTWFSTFTGYINRMRGYLGYSMKDSWYGWLPRKEILREYKYPVGNYNAREWPIGWIAIDGDQVIEHEGVPVPKNVGDSATPFQKRKVCF